MKTVIVRNPSEHETSVALFKAPVDLLIDPLCVFDIAPGDEFQLHLNDDEVLVHHGKGVEHVSGPAEAVQHVREIGMPARAQEDAVRQAQAAPSEVPGADAAAAQADQAAGDNSAPDGAPLVVNSPVPTNSDSSSDDTNA